MNIHQASLTLPHTQTSACARRAAPTCRSRRRRAAVIRTNPHPPCRYNRHTRFFPQCEPYFGQQGSCCTRRCEKNYPSELTQGLERLQEEEKAKLERSLDEQTRSILSSYSNWTSGAGQAQGPGVLISVLSSTKSRSRFAKAYREKLEQELQLRSDIINGRCVSSICNGAVILTLSSQPEEGVIS